jgi:phosphoglycolate phosphatase
MSAATIVFDLDGTLVDTAPDLIDTLNIMLARHGEPPVAYDAARSLIGGGVRPLIERALVARNLGTAEIDAIFKEYLDHYVAHIADRSRPYPGVIAALDLLEHRGHRFAVCTNKLEWLAVRLLEALALKDRFAAICGPDTFGIRKPDPAILHQTLARAGGRADRAVMIGDSGTDVVTARAARMPVVLVDFGYTEIPVGELGADRVIGHFDALPEAVDALLAPAG